MPGGVIVCGSGLCRVPVQLFERNYFPLFVDFTLTCDKSKRGGDILFVGGYTYITITERFSQE